MESEICERLPEDILIRILAFLPTFIVLRLRAVCKRWNRRISSPHTFPSDVPLSSAPAFLACWSHSLTSPANLLLIGGRSYDCFPVSRLSTLSLDFLPRNSNPIKIVAACKGLLCCSYYREPNVFYICNPSTRTYTKLPRSNQLTTWDFIALAFHSSPRRYNLVIGRKETMRHCPVNTVVEIYDSVTDSWTQLQMTTNRTVNPQGEGIYSRGRFYWISANHVGVIRIDVVGLHVQEGVWEVIMRPQGPYRGYLHYWQLTGQDGRVILVYKADLSLWKLNEDEHKADDHNRGKWCALPVSCLSHITDNDLSSQTCVQVVASCSGWILVYFPNRKMVVLDEEGRIVRKIEGEQLSSSWGDDRWPTSVRGFEVNNVWWPC